MAITNAQTLFAVAIIVWLFRDYRRNSVEAPSTQLPFQDLVDVRRWHHDGQQPTTDSDGNRKPIPWD